MRAAHRMGVTPVYRTLDAAPRARSAAPTSSSRPCRRTPPTRSRTGSTARPQGVLLDVAYDPRPTALSVAWAAAGGAVVGGEQMLLHQAAEQVRLMTGHAGAARRDVARALEDKLAA